MPASKAHMKATQKYESNNYDKVLLRIRRDSSQNREAITAAAEKAGLSLNAFILEAISEKINQLEADPEDQEEEK
jgi:predicted HicB family RNase H-like nuclease